MRQGRANCDVAVYVGKWKRLLGLAVGLFLIIVLVVVWWWIQICIHEMIKVHRYETIVMCVY